MTRTVAELIEALRVRAALINGQSWEAPATAAMMLEAADALAVAQQLEAYVEHEWRCAAKESGPCTCGLDALRSPRS